MRKIGSLIQVLRTEKGWTQNDVAKKIGVTEKAVGKWEQGKGDPDIDLLLPLARLFGISSDELMEGKRNEIVLDFSMSVLERVVLGGIPAVEQSLSNGINLQGVDEYKNTIFDYIYKHRKIDLLRYAIHNKWLQKVDYVVFDYEYIKNFAGENKQKNIPHFGVFFTRPQVEKAISYSFVKSTNQYGDPTGADLRVMSFGIDRKAYQTTFPYPARINAEARPYDADVYGILSIIIEHEDIELLKSLPYYQFFFEKKRLLDILNIYIKRKSFSDSFVSEICKHNDAYFALMELAARENKTELIQTLAKKYDSSIQFNIEDNLKNLVRANHPIINEKILSKLDPSHYHGIIQDVLLYNKQIYNRLPLETKKACATALGVVSDLNSEEMDGVLLYQKPEAIILSKNTALLQKYLIRVDEASNQVLSFFKDLTEMKPKANGEYVIDPKMVQRFDNLHKSHFNFKPVVRYVDGDKILPTKPAALELIKRGVEDVRYLQDVMNEKKEKMTLESLMLIIIPAFQTTLECKYADLYDDAILTLAPYLSNTQKSYLLNRYNRDNPTLIQKLLELGAVFILENNKPYWNDPITLTYCLFGGFPKSKQSGEEQQLKDKTDHIKTMQFKQLFQKRS
jgi:transcriptional regulator with XRE-family HTH domain